MVYLLSNDQESLFAGGETPTPTQPLMEVIILDGQAKQKLFRTTLAWGVIGEELGECSTCRFSNLLVIEIGHGCEFRVDLDAQCPIALGDLREAGCRVHHAGGADADKKIAPGNDSHGLSNYLLVEHISEPHDIGPQPVLAFVTFEALKGFTAVFVDAVFGAAHSPETAVQFDHFFTARALVHAVDVLGDDSDAGVPFFQPGEDKMPGMGLAGQHRFAPQFMEFQYLYRVTVKGILARVVFIIVLVPDAAPTPVGGYTAFGRHAGPGKKHDPFIITWFDHCCSHSLLVYNHSFNLSIKGQDPHASPIFVIPGKTR